jgi:hypothetical protein
MTDQPRGGERGRAARRDVVIIGSGSLARALCCSCAAVLDGAFRILVAARSGDRAAEICRVANAESSLRDAKVRFDPAGADFDRAEDVASLVSRTRPTVVVVCASLQSPWESRSAPSGWTDFIRRAGYGVTLPLQARIAATFARAIAEHAPDALLINACLPDVTNRALTALGLPVFCGIGNVATIAATLQSALQAPSQDLLQVLSHHVQLHDPPPGCAEALAWYDGQPIDGITELLAGQRATSGRALNHVAALSAALLLDALLRDVKLLTSLPGPLGLPGGYPVRITGRHVELRLPPEVSRHSAVEWNTEVGLFDGVAVSGSGQICFSAPGVRALRDYAPELAEGFPAEDLASACEQLLRVRDRLRGMPACATPEGK